MLYIDKMNNTLVIITNFCNLLPIKNCNQKEVLIKTYYSNLKTKTQIDFIENFQNRNIKILISTNIIRININIPNIIFMV